VLCSSQDHLGTKTHDLGHHVLVVAENNDNWHAMKEDLHGAFSLDVLMVSSSVLIIAADDECLSDGGFSLNETIRFGSLEFITDNFGGVPYHGPLRVRWPLVG
jgi:hypothetical protein